MAGEETGEGGESAGGSAVMSLWKAREECTIRLMHR
jgi:hypothetical protein